MALSPATLQAITACHDAAIEPGAWPVALQRLGESFGAQSCTFGTWDASRDPVRMPRSDGHESFAQLWLANQSHAPDPHIERGRRLAQRHVPYVLEDDISSELERRKMPYYGEIADPGDRQWWAAINFEVGSRAGCLPLYRGANRGPFTAGEARDAAEAASHLAHLVRLCERLADSTLAVGLNMLERFCCAAVVIDERGAMVRTNRAADRLLDAGLYLHRSQFRMAGQRASVDFGAQLLPQVGQARPDGERAAQVLDREGMPALLIEVLPMAAFGCDYFAPGVAVVTLTELMAPRLGNPVVLTEAFGLTRAEALLAAEVARGKGIAAAAASLGIGVETARSQLHAVFAKTRTSRQAELVGLLARFRR